MFDSIDAILGNLLLAVVGTLVVLAAAYNAVAFACRLKRHRRHVRYEGGYCAGCGYDIRANIGRCPECGADLFAQATTYWTERLAGP
jgi:predicted Zn-ribbon and HTH transcriptional regulator